MRADIKEILQELDGDAVDFYINHMQLTTIETAMHKHTKDQLLYAEGGIVHIFIQEKHWYLPARCFMWIPAGVQHSIVTYSKKVELYNMYFKRKSGKDMFFTTPNIYFANDLLREMFLYTKDWFGKIEKSDAAKYYFLRAIQHNIPLMESTKLPVLIQHPFPKDAKLFQIAQFLNSNLESNFTIEQIAVRFGISARTLSRKFKDDLGMNYVRFLRSLRITKAFELIAENQFSMYEISLMVGYSSLSAFSNVFNTIAGIRPTDYARLLKAPHKDQVIR